jgi:hypothetical protein
MKVKRFKKDKKENQNDEGRSKPGQGWRMVTASVKNCGQSFK